MSRCLALKGTKPVGLCFGTRDCTVLSNSYGVWHDCQMWFLAIPRTPRTGASMILTLLALP
jgi:hypothetical protein